MPEGVLFQASLLTHHYLIYDMAVFRLALRNLASYRVRFGLTVAAIALSISLVVAVTSGYRSIHDAAQKMLEQYMGTMDAQLTMRNQPRGGIEQGIVQQIKTDPTVERVDGRLEIESGLLDPNGKAIVGRSVQLIGIERPADTRVNALELIAGHWFSSSDGDEAVIDQVARDRLGVKIGDTFYLPTPDGKLPLRVVGFVHKPGILAQAIQTAYVPLHTLQKFSLPNQPGQLSRVLIDLKEGVDPDAFYARWQPKIEALNPLLKLQLASENRRQMDRNLQGLAVLSYLGSSVALIASAFIVFSALAMGVMERQRVLATLRAVGASRAQLGGLVLAEAAMLAFVGVVLGVPLGVVWIKLLAAMFPTLFSAGGVVSGAGVALAIGGDLLVAGAASALPALSAMRSSPLDAMLTTAGTPRPRGLWIAAAAGLACMAIDPLLIFLPTPRSVQFYGHFSIGLGGVMLGAFLIAPLLIRGLEIVLGPIVSKLLGVRPELLRQQLSGAPWRAAGSAAALMIGLSTLIVTQVQGQSSIGAWKIPDKFPDIFIFSASGLSAEQVDQLRSVPGVVGKDVMPIAIASPQFGKGIFAIIGMALLPDATMYFGINPDNAFDLMALDFRDGNPTDARRMLKLGRHIIVTEEFKQLRGMHVGSKLALKTNQGTIDFTVAGVVWSPGIDVINSFQDLGKQFDQRTAASLFGTLDDAKQYFGVDHYQLTAANLQPGLDKKALLVSVNESLGTMGLEAGDVRQIKAGIQSGLSRLLNLVSTMSFAAMGLAALGVTNTIMASIRSRRWQFGVLRSVGLDRGTLLRLIVAEAVLLGLVSVVLGTIAGLQTSIDARGIWKNLLGLETRMIIPWPPILLGAGVVMGVCLAASLIPAIRASRTDVLSLLQAGRATA